MRLDRAVQRDLLGCLGEAFAQPTAYRSKLGSDGFLGHGGQELLEDLLDRDPADGHRGGGGGRGGAERQRHRDDQGDQLDDEERDLDPDFEFGGLDVAAALLDHLRDLVGGGHQLVDGGVVTGGDGGPGGAERVHDRAGLAVAVDERGGAGSGVRGGGGERAGDRVPLVGEVPDGTFVAFGPFDADDPFEAFADPAGGVEPEQVERVRHGARQCRHESPRTPPRHETPIQAGERQ
uniref:hypothetical protein n=1 Tax=Catenuloplanes japonicus TaxID=33876 RepID=UPI0012F94468|nr:hypothetical protein [Catenuloplanes japonicus]